MGQEKMAAKCTTVHLCIVPIVRARFPHDLFDNETRQPDRIQQMVERKRLGSPGECFSLHLPPAPVGSHGPVRRK